MATSVETLAVNTVFREHIRKGKKVAAFIAPTSIAVPTAITTGGVAGAPVTLVELTGFKALGLLSKSEGVTMGRNRETSEVMAVGYNDSVRSDVTTDEFNAAVVGLETNRITIENYLGVDLSTVTPDANTGEISFPQPSDGIIRQNRWMYIAQDGVGADRWWIARCFAAGEVRDTDDQSWASDDDPIGWPLTVTSTVDTTLGYSVRHYFGGGGWKARLSQLGFTG